MGAVSTVVDIHVIPTERTQDTIIIINFECELRTLYGCLVVVQGWAKATGGDEERHSLCLDW